MRSTAAPRSLKRRLFEDSLDREKMDPDEVFEVEDDCRHAMYDGVVELMKTYGPEKLLVCDWRSIIEFCITMAEDSGDYTGHATGL